MAPRTETPSWLSSVLVKNPDFVFRRIDDEGILIPIRANVSAESNLLALDPTAVRVWELIDGHPAGKDLVRALAEEYDADEATLAEDVGKFVELLVTSGGLRLRSAA